MSIKDYVKKYVSECGIFVPDNFWGFDEVELAVFTNGCGPRGFGDKIVPDKLLFLSVKAACIIHDFSYNMGETPEDKNRADFNFLVNMLHIINAKSRFWPFKMIRRRLALAYYDAVSEFGEGCFKDKSYKGEPK